MKKFKSQNADKINEFFFIGKRTMAIAENGDEYPGTVIALNSAREKVTINFDDGGRGDWNCGSTSKFRLT